MNSKLSGRVLASLIIFSLIGQIAWVVENMYFNVFIYKMFRANAAAISTMVSASAVAATLTTILMGALSDKVGKRKLFITGGYIVWGISILAFALIRMDILTGITGSALEAMSLGVSLVIIMDCVMTFFGSTANDACFNAWLTDSTNEGSRGKAEGINSMMPLLAVLVVFGGFMGFDLDKAESWTLIYLIIGGVVLFSGLLGIFLLEDPKLTPQKNDSLLGTVIYGFRPNVIRENRALYHTLLSFVLFSISIQVFMPYLILYYTVGLRLDNYVLILAPAIILASVVTFVYGRIYDRFGYSRTVIPTILLLMAGYTLLYFFRQIPPVFIGTFLMLSGYLSGMAVFGAMIRDNTPAGKAGRFQGLRIFSQVLIPGVIGPWIGAFVLRNADTILNDDGTRSFIPNQSIFLAAFVAAVVALAAVLLFRRRQAAEKS
ncbi:MAG: MFS transporter [Oscillospiraceae bacterium]|nr:MFS transporter [Oscillospiraceae bacterium]